MTMAFFRKKKTRRAAGFLVLGLLSCLGFLIDQLGWIGEATSGRFFGFVMGFFAGMCLTAAWAEAAVGLSEQIVAGRAEHQSDFARRMSFVCLYVAMFAILIKWLRGPELSRDRVGLLVRVLILLMVFGFVVLQVASWCRPRDRGDH